MPQLPNSELRANPAALLDCQPFGKRSSSLTHGGAGESRTELSCAGRFVCATYDAAQSATTPNIQMPSMVPATTKVRSHFPSSATVREFRSSMRSFRMSDSDSQILRGTRPIPETPCASTRRQATGGSLVLAL